jgi:hypothetical protein
MKPIQLRKAHKKLNEILFPYFDLTPDANDEEIVERLAFYYEMMSHSQDN